MLPHITADDPIVTALRNDKVAIESINTPFKRIKVRQVGEDIQVRKRGQTLGVFLKGQPIIQEHIENLVQNDVTSGVMRKRTPAMMNKRSKPDVLGGVVKYFGWEPYPTRLAEQSTQLKLCLNSFFSSRSTRVRNMHEHLARFCNSSTIVRCFSPPPLSSSLKGALKTGERRKDPVQPDRGVDGHAAEALLPGRLDQAQPPRGARRHVFKRRCPGRARVRPAHAAAGLRRRAGLVGQRQHGVPLCLALPDVHHPARHDQVCP